MFYWSSISKTKSNEELKVVLIDGEEILQCYQTIRDQAALTDKRIIIFDKQGLTDKKTEIYSLPYRSIDMRSTENADKLFDVNAELELRTEAGRFRIRVDPKFDIKEFDWILGNTILNRQ